MANVRDIKRRIRAIENTRKITRAMEMVAAAKLRRALERAVAARPYADRLARARGRLAAAGAVPE
ncbi:MAG: F0F1 ATP synthase subunit gamma, partial [Clostridia bacterium]|nr:F0F1 ATP synthase subunit gamma [Clostridia bacterium]